ncbi:MAG: methyltransferase domain-containing protein [Peptococcaceae bacterium]|nr:methyltransferase domain-containing protein [Peptococcaceae bacterium]
MLMDGLEVHTKEFWDERSKKWVNNFESEESRQENEKRYQYVDEFLTAQGLYNHNSEIFDIGCGPGMFAIRFAQKAKKVTGLDISEKMLDYARLNTEKKGLKNVSFINIPWQDIVLKDYGLEKAFDLVFASLCPGISSEDSLLKMSLASREWCFTCSFARKFSSLKNMVYQHILGVPFNPDWGQESLGRSVNFLLQSGYYPYISYYDTSAQRTWEVNSKTAARFAGHLGSIKDEDRNIKKYSDAVLSYLKSIAVDNKITEKTEAKIAFLYWRSS